MGYLEGDKSIRKVCLPHGTSSIDAQKTGTGVLKKSVLYKTAQSSGIEMMCHPGLNRCRLQFSRAYFLFSERVDISYKKCACFKKVHAEVNIGPYFMGVTYVIL